MCNLFQFPAIIFSLVYLMIELMFSLFAVTWLLALVSTNQVRSLTKLGDATKAIGDGL